MTALQDWLSLRPIDQNAIVDFVFRPFRAVLGSTELREDEEFTTMCAGVERC